MKSRGKKTPFRHNGARPAGAGGKPSIPAGQSPDPRLTLQEAIGFHQRGDLATAESLYRQLLDAEPNNGDALHFMGILQHQLGNSDESLTFIGRAAAVMPRFPEVHNNMGNIYREIGRYREAERCLRKAVALNPLFGPAHYNLGLALEAQGRLTEALESFLKGHKYQPDNPFNCVKIGNQLSYRHEFAEARLFYRQALALKRDYTEAHSNLLLSAQYDPEQTPASLYELHREWDAMHGKPLPATFANDRNPERQLKIGYISRDLGRHPIGYFMTPLLESHNPDQVKTFCYFDREQEDDLTVRLRGAAAVWRTTHTLSHAALFDQVRSDEIDILVDLSGHMEKNRLPTFALKPAPIQMTWAGYVGTTGLSAMDYILSDSQQTPEGVDEWFSETIIRLPNDYVCYAAPDYAPPVGPLPALTRQHVTFGSFNNQVKIHPGVIALWARILRALPTARLLFIDKNLGDAGMRSRYRQLFADQGVADRVEMGGVLPHAELLERYNGVDIALDPFPYSGGLTTLESLWMGVPVITREGERFASRHTITHLTTVDLGEFITSSEDEYLRLAVTLADRTDYLAEIRKGLRQRMLTSPLCDGAGFARNLERVYRDAWKQWCITHKE